ncbi:MAG: hypothetical protein JW820_17280 [Spirochaetales bacterium]|nr:hypothetical protein [Spirochaetales bacterium]
MAKNEKPNKMINYVMGGIFDGILLWVLHQLPRWNVPVITEAYPDILTVVTLSLAVQIAFHAVLVLFHPLWLHYLAQVVFAVFSVIALSVIIEVYPFDFAGLVGPWLDTAFRILLIVILVGSVIGGIVNLVRFLRALARRGERQAGDA